MLGHLPLLTVRASARVVLTAVLVPVMMEEQPLTPPASPSGQFSGSKTSVSYVIQRACKWRT
jgi:hypothetical protein